MPFESLWLGPVYRPCCWLAEAGAFCFVVEVACISFEAHLAQSAEAARVTRLRIAQLGRLRG